MELLTTVHWVATREGAVLFEDAVDKIYTIVRALYAVFKSVGDGESFMPYSVHEFSISKIQRRRVGDELLHLSYASSVSQNERFSA
jgi:hypothetical protein